MCNFEKFVEDKSQVLANVIWCHQDEAPPHYRNKVRKHHEVTFPNGWIDKR